MSSRARIAIMKDNKGKSIYLHNQSYPEYMMPILEYSFISIKDVIDLLEIGDITSTAKKVSNKANINVIAYAGNIGKELKGLLMFNLSSLFDFNYYLFLTYEFVVKMISLFSCLRFSISCITWNI